MKTVTLYYTLEAFTLCGTYYFHLIAFSENVNSNGFTDIFFDCEIAKFFRKLFGGSGGFGEVVCFGLNGVLFVFVAERELESIVTVRIFGLDLCNDAGTGFDNGARGLPALGIENAGHANLFPNNTFHTFNLCLQVYWDMHRFLSLPSGRRNLGVNPRLLPTFSFCLEVPIVNKP